MVQVELHAEDINGENPQAIESNCKDKITGAIHSRSYRAEIASTRPVTYFVPRIVHQHAEAQIPAQASLISWQL